MRTGNSFEEKLNNAGFSLVELIVAVLIMGVVALLISTFLLTSRTAYEKVDTAAEIQTEAEAATTFIRNIAVEALAAGSGRIMDNVGNSCEVIWFLSSDDKNPSGTRLNYYYFVVHDRAADALRYCKKLAGDETGAVAPAGGEFTNDELQAILGGTSVIGNPYCLLAEHIMNDPSKGELVLNTITGEHGTLIEVAIKFEYAQSGEYKVSVKSLARNMSKMH